MKGNDVPPPDRAHYIPPAWAGETDPKSMAAEGRTRKKLCIIIVCVVVALVRVTTITLLVIQMDEGAHMESGKRVVCQ